MVVLIITLIVTFIILIIVFLKYIKRSYTCTVLSRWESACQVIFNALIATSAIIVPIWVYNQTNNHFNEIFKQTNEHFEKTIEVTSKQFTAVNRPKVLIRGVKGTSVEFGIIPFENVGNLP